jgi:hypothetical protein
MKQSIFPRVLYVPLLVAYFGTPFIHDVYKFYSNFNIVDWSALLGIYSVGLIICSPLLYLVIKMEPKQNIQSMGFYCRIVFCNIVQVASVFLLWSNPEGMYVALLITMIMSFMVMAIGRKDLVVSKCIIRDKKTGALYQVKNGQAFLLSDTSTETYLLNNKGNNITELSSGNASSVDSNSPVIPLSSFSGGIGSVTNVGALINPSSGLPMTGGMSGLDVAGNSWGTNFNDPTSNNTYDPNRGY